MLPLFHMRHMLGLLQERGGLSRLCMAAGWLCCQRI